MMGVFLLANRKQHMINNTNEPRSLSFQLSLFNRGFSSNISSIKFFSLGFRRFVIFQISSAFAPSRKTCFFRDDCLFHRLLMKKYLSRREPRTRKRVRTEKRERRNENEKRRTRTRVLLRTAELIVYVKKCFQRITLYWGHVLLAFVLIHGASDLTDPVPMDRPQPIGEWRGLRDLRDLQDPMETYLKMAYAVAT